MVPKRAPLIRTEGDNSDIRSAGFISKGSSDGDGLGPVLVRSLREGSPRMVKRKGEGDSRSLKLWVALVFPHLLLFGEFGGEMKTLLEDLEY